MSADPVAPVFEAEWGRLVAGLIGWCGDWDLAEECAAEAFARAVTAWRDEIPDNPRAWLVTVARNQARDRLRRRTTEDRKLALVAGDRTGADAAADAHEIADDRLRLIFTCCHPALPMEARIALSLRTLCGLTSAEIARAFLVSESTMEKRLVRARAKIKAAGIPFRVPPRELLPQRATEVLAVLYLMFNEGYAASSGDLLMRVDVSAEAIRLGRLFAELLPEDPEAASLVALMLLTDARRGARVQDRRLIPLAEQDRTRWDQSSIAAGHAILAQVAELPGPVGPYRVQASIAAVHAGAAAAIETDWRRIASLYELLPPTPVTELNRAVAVSMAEGPEAALPIVLPLADQLDGYYLFHATVADLATRSGRPEVAAGALTRAIALAPTQPERRLLEARLATINVGRPR